MKLDFYRVGSLNAINWTKEILRFDPICKLTNASIHALTDGVVRGERLPAGVVAKVQPLLDKPFDSEVNFSSALSALLAGKENEKYGHWLLSNSRGHAFYSREKGGPFEGPFTCVKHAEDAIGWAGKHLECRWLSSDGRFQIVDASAIYKLPPIGEALSTPSDLPCGFTAALTVKTVIDMVPSVVHDAATDKKSEVFKQVQKFTDCFWVWSGQSNKFGDPWSPKSLNGPFPTKAAAIAWCETAS